MYDHLVGDLVDRYARRGIPITGALRDIGDPGLPCENGIAAALEGLIRSGAGAGVGSGSGSGSGGGSTGGCSSCREEEVKTCTGVGCPLVSLTQKSRDFGEEAVPPRVYDGVDNKVRENLGGGNWATLESPYSARAKGLPDPTGKDAGKEPIVPT